MVHQKQQQISWKESVAQSVYMQVPPQPEWYITHIYISLVSGGHLILVPVPCFQLHPILSNCIRWYPIASNFSILVPSSPEPIIPIDIQLSHKYRVISNLTSLVSGRAHLCGELSQVLLRRLAIRSIANFFVLIFFSFEINYLGGWGALSSPVPAIRSIANWSHSPVVVVLVVLLVLLVPPRPPPPQLAIRSIANWSHSPPASAPPYFNIRSHSFPSDFLL